MTPMRTGWLPTVVVAALLPAAAESAPRRETIAAWDRYVAAASARVHERRTAEPEGAALDIPGGTIHHWRSSTLVRGATVDALVQRLMYPGTPPPQEEVVDARVLARRGDTLRVYVKLRRSAIVTVTYDTEHDVVFRRNADGWATSRSVATRITETGGGDRGFLWRLNSYWRYTPDDGGVRIDVESISLSRAVPLPVRPIVGPLVQRIARDSLVRTLEAVAALVRPRLAHDLRELVVRPDASMNGHVLRHVQPQPLDVLLQGAHVRVDGRHRAAGGWR